LSLGGARQQNAAGNYKGNSKEFAQAMYTRFFYKNGDGNFEAVQGLPKEDVDDSYEKKLKDGFIYEGVVIQSPSFAQVFHDERVLRIKCSWADEECSNDYRDSEIFRKDST
jgi:hypothetical protein